MQMYAHRQEHGVVYCNGCTKEYRFLSLKSSSKRFSPQLTITGEQLNDYAIAFFGVTLLPTTAWGKLYHHTILKSVEFPKINIFNQEDIVLNLYTWPQITSIVIIDYQGYHYRQGSGGSGKATPQYINDFRELYGIKRDTISAWNYGHNALDYTKIELKNCFFEYFTRLIQAGKSKSEILDTITQELEHSEYTEICTLSNEFSHLLKEEDYAALIARDVQAIYDIALRQHRKRRIRRFIRHFL